VKYFICALGRPAGAQSGSDRRYVEPKVRDSLPDTVNLGIPAEQTERIIPLTRLQTGVMESENQEVFISIPVLFRQEDTSAPHGLVLKSGPAAGKRPGKTILMTPRIDIDLEIPEESIRRLPEAFSGQFPFLRGACFAGQNMILILDPDKLVSTFGAGFFKESLQ